MASCSHPLDQLFIKLLDTLQLEEFVDHYRGLGVLSEEDIEVLYSNSAQSTRRHKIDYLVRQAKKKDPNLKNFLRALKRSDQSKHNDLMSSLESAMKEISESRPESPVGEMSRSFSNLSLDNYDCGVDVASKFTQVCCSGCTSPVNIIGDTDDLMSFYKRTNPHGYIHKFYQLRGILPKCRIKYDGTWHSEHTWFQNYSWMIINCKDCNLHWGWYFSTRSDDDNFYGIRQDAVCLRAKNYVI